MGPGEGWPWGPAGLGWGAAAMIRAFSFPVSPERGRLRGWLEGSLAGLCELHWLRERQEYRVQQALRLAQPGMGGAEAEDEEDADEDEDAAAARRAAAALEEQLVRGRLSVHPSAPVCVCLSVSVGCSDTRSGGGGGKDRGWDWRPWSMGAGRDLACPPPNWGRGTASLPLEPREMHRPLPQRKFFWALSMCQAWAEYLACAVFLKLGGERGDSPHFTEQEAEAQRWQATHPRSHSWDPNMPPSGPATRAPSSLSPGVLGDLWRGRGGGRGSLGFLREGSPLGGSLQSAMIFTLR